MDRQGFPDQDQLLQFLKRLKEVFDVCDEDADGFIRVEHLMDLGLQFGQGDEVKKLTKHLCPNAHGKINFKDFCHAVFAIKGKTFFVSFSLSQKVLLDLCCECFNIHLVPDFLRFQGGPPSKQADELSRPWIKRCWSSYIPSDVPAEGTTWPHGLGEGYPPTTTTTTSPPLLGSPGEKWWSTAGLVRNEEKLLYNPRYVIGSASAPLIPREEQFEDYGEGVDADFSPSSPCPEDDSRTNGFSDLGSSLPSSAGHTPQKMQQLYNSDLLDIYCSQCCKKVNLLNDLEARLRNLKANSPNRKISSTAFGRQLFQANQGVFGSSQCSSTEDLFTDSIDSCDLDITEKVSYLEKKVTELESDSLANSDLKSKLKQENTHLVHRVHELEEQVKDVETKATETLGEEMKRHREAYSKMERDRNTEIDLLCCRVQHLEEENGEMTINVSRLKSQSEKLDQEKQRMTDKLEDTSLRLKDEVDLYRKIMDKLWHNRHEFQKEKEAMQELIDDLRRELDHLQLFKLEMEHPGKGKGLSEYNAKNRETEMEHEVKRLKQENFKLRDQNDDLNAQILSLSLYEAKNLFSCHTKAQCLAAEIDNASRDELVDALKEQEEINLRLRQYMDKIILAILDHNPSILEIKN
uniref:RAB11 family interacting protein 4 (class II) a n=1 Tax=Fundulus heteroclitus TaxID=8078 RepID=A0A3Q2Q616_FUNHE